ncbi:xanthine dehydrogenase/oxidase-like [Panulirus ornatus]|uniref:xanthine dehydrogenase/oxidase-like n=1 Tax=Panulirus ornatus TaxID=150431 RepID=UPI003A899816
MRKALSNVPIKGSSGGCIDNSTEDPPVDITEHSVEEFPRKSAKGSDANSPENSTLGSAASSPVIPTDSCGADPPESCDIETYSSLVFFVNGRRVVEKAVDPELTLLLYLREKLRLTGSKLGCGEGGCGACTVMLSRYHHSQRVISHYCVNACLTPVAAVHGMAVTTVEGVGSLKTRLHVVQERLANAHGSQCGFCTPGIVMAMYTLLRNKHLPSQEDVLENLTGNLCRCTGYRPILDGFGTLTAKTQVPAGCGRTNCCRTASPLTEDDVGTKKNKSVSGRGTEVDESVARVNGRESDQGIQANGRVDGDAANECVAKDDPWRTDNANKEGFHVSDHTNNSSLNTPDDDDVENNIFKSGDHASHSGLKLADHDNFNPTHQNQKNNANIEVHILNGSLRTPEHVGNGDTVHHDVLKPEECVRGSSLNGHGEHNSVKTNGCVEDCSVRVNDDVTRRSRAKGHVQCDEASQGINDDDSPRLSTGYDPTQEIIFPPELKMSSHLDRQTLMYQGPRVTYWRPTTLAHLLTLKHRHPYSKIIVGNTEVGVEVNTRNKLYPILINPSKVSEMTRVSLVESGLVIGASVTLSTLQKTLQHQVDTQPDYMTRSFSAILEMLKWFAGKQIRNAASLGGNIMTSSPISDLNPVLVAAGSSLTFISLQDGEREMVMDQTFFTGYRQNSARSTEVLLAVHIPFTQQEDYIHSYKQSRRPDDDITIVNAAMRVRMVAGTCRVAQLSLIFGGMAATTVHAPKTMKELVGRSWDTSLLQKGTDLLLEDLPLSPNAPGGMVEYRRTLTISFFLKFYLSVRGWLSENVGHLVRPLSQDELSASSPFPRPTAISTQSFQQVPESQGQHDLVGRPVVHTSAFSQTTGEAVYVEDIPHVENELHAALVVSSRAHAKILAIDETRALQLEGVEAFFCARDLPGEKNITGPVTADEQVFAQDKVVCVGQVVGVVVARDHATARQAATLVNIHYQDLGPPIITIQDAIRAQSWWEPWTVNRGNVEEGFKIAAHLLEGEMYIGGQEHFYMEPNAHIAVPKGENNEIDVFSTTQNPTGTQQLVAKALGVPSNRVVVHVKRVGGGFGGKETRSCCVSVPAAVAAARLNRAVRIRLERQEDMLVTGGRHPFLFRWKVGFTPEGRLTALQARLYSNAGCSLDLSDSLMIKALCSLDSAYNHQNLCVTGYSCKTNLPSNTAFRGFGVPQAVMFIEDILSQMAAFLRLDPVKVRETNMYRVGDMTIVSYKLEQNLVAQCWRQVLDNAEFEARKARVQDFNRSNTYRKRGLAATPVHFGIGFERVLNQAGALVHAYTDGSVLLTHAGIEMGQGLHTKMIQVASRALGVSSDVVHISETCTNKVPNTSPTAASISTDLNGMAVLNACQELSRRLQPYKERSPEGSWRDWVEAAYSDQVSLSATGFYRIAEISFNPVTLTGQPFSYYTSGAAVTEVEIDCLTGRHMILRTDIVMDIGNSLNPALDIGQIEGAFMQGVGLVTLEELCYSPEGVLLTRGPGAYKIPGFQDIPCGLHVTLVRDSPNPKAVFSSKAVGEPPLVLATSVFQAIKAAVTAAREDNHLPRVFRLDSPATAERIRLACGDHFTRKVKVATRGPQPDKAGNTVC